MAYLGDLSRSIRQAVLAEGGANLYIDGVAHDLTSMSPKFMERVSVGEYITSLVLPNSAKLDANEDVLSSELYLFTQNGTLGSAVWFSPYDNNIYTISNGSSYYYYKVMCYNVSHRLLRKTGDANVGGYYSPLFVDEDENKLYAISFGSEATDNRLGFVYDKGSNSLTLMPQLPLDYTATFSVIHKTSTAIYVAYAAYNTKDNLRIVKYNKNDNTITDLQAYSYGGSKYVLSIPSKAEVSGNTVTFYTLGVDSNTNYVVVKTTIDTDTDTVSYTTCSFDFGEQAQADVMPVFTGATSQPSSEHLYKCALRCVLYSDSHGVDYIIATAEVAGGAVDINNYDPMGLWVFEKGGTDGTTLTYKSSYTDIGIHAILSIGAEFSKILVSYTSGVTKTLAFNDTDQQYEEASTLTTSQISNIGVDSANRIFVYTSGTGILDIFMADIPTTVKVVPEFDNYEYQGTQIDSYLAVSAYNHVGDRIAVNVKLKLVGSNVTFDNGVLETTIATSDTDDVQVPIHINGPSFIRVAATVVV